MKKINFTKAHFIKLGTAGCWENECIEKNILKIGFNEISHNDCLNGNWDRASDQYVEWLAENRNRANDRRTASFFINQMKKFYESDAETLWITFHNRMLYWSFADENIRTDSENNKIKDTCDGWSNADINGQKLSFDVLSTSLTMTQAFKSAICDIQGRSLEYLKHKINGDALPEVEAVTTDFAELKKSLMKLIKNLTWKDFELLVDLIFTFGGWKRIETLGKEQKSIDLDLISPIDNRRAFVQVKSQADSQTFKEYYAEFKNMPQYNEMFFIVHTPIGELDRFDGDGKDKIIKLDRLTELAINAGLTDWIIKKSK